MIALWLALGALYVVVGQIVCGALMQDWDPAEKLDRRVGIFFGLLWPVLVSIEAVLAVVSVIHDLVANWRARSHEES